MNIPALPQNRPLRILALSVLPHKTPFCEFEEEQSELVHLISTSGNMHIVRMIQRRKTPHPKTYLGKGKIEEAKHIIKEEKIDLVITNDLLKGKQLIMLQKELHTHIWDKVDLILSIFAKHAKSNQAKLQVKLAKLRYDIPRIYTYHSTTLFERAGAGIGTKGAGERGIEEEKRHLRKMIKQTEEKLEQIKITQDNQRKKRRRKSLPMVAIVGYTNAGKSTLIRALTQKNVYIADELFATLDTRIGRKWSEKLSSYILFADTIGFIRNLPPFLIDSFTTTLQEAQNADLILHIFDGSSPFWKKKVETTEKILSQIGCDDIPQILVANKNDRGCPLFCTKETILISTFSKKSLQQLFSQIEDFVK